MYDVLVHKVSIREVMRRREVDVACASIDLAGAEIAMSTMIGRERALQKAFVPIREDYDFICIDTPPSLGLLTINALTAADKVIVPVQCEYLSMRGLIQLQNTLAMIRENLNPAVDIEGILPDLGRFAHDSRQGGDRDPRGELRRPRVRVSHPQDGALRRGAGEGHVRAQVRARRHGRPVLSPACAGGAGTWPTLNSARACVKARWQRSSARQKRTISCRAPQPPPAPMRPPSRSSHRRPRLQLPLNPPCLSLLPVSAPRHRSRLRLPGTTRRPVVSAVRHRWPPRLAAAPHIPLWSTCSNRAR